MTASESTFAQLRRRERERRIAALRQRLSDTLGPTDCSVWLFGSLARGDWDGFSDTDLLVVAPSREEAERAADQLGEALLGEDVLAIAQARWEAMDHSASPHWRAIRAQAIRLHPQP
ncbi:MAG: nucleotidyltransferase domain-containing protein [Cyanobacteriota bacterium]|nr:nucleotidyltransferase domain-containing protein [Cyanobacteriota bacterium]